MTMVYVDQAGQLVALCDYCGYWRASDGPYCSECADWLNGRACDDANPRGIERPTISRGGQ